MPKRKAADRPVYCSELHMADGDGDGVSNIGMAGVNDEGAVPELVGERLAKHKAVIAAKCAMVMLAIFVTPPLLPPLRTRDVVSDNFWRMI